MPKTDDHARIEALEREVKDLRKRLDESTRPTPVSAEPPKPKADYVERRASVTDSPPMKNASFVMPNDAQLHQLLDIACRKFPVLRKGISTGRFADQDERDFFNEYASAFCALGTVSRLPAGEVDEKHSADRWIRVVRNRLQGGSQSVGLLPLTAAVICHNDIPFMLNPNHMMSSSFGLRDDGAGIMASDAWQRVISSNTVRDSLPLPLPARTWRMGTVRAG
jgi:hypothetical protein